MKNKTPLYIILSIGLLTPLLSTLLFFFWSPDKYNNIGTILEPIPLQANWHLPDGKPFDISALEGQWIILFAGDGSCDDNCQQYLCKTRQLRRMMHGHYLRVQRIWLITDNTPPPATLLQTTDCGQINPDKLQGHIQTVDTLKEVNIVYGETTALPADTAATNYLYILDPKGIWAMRFSADNDLYEIRKDFSRLLYLSKGHKKI